MNKIGILVLTLVFASLGCGSSSGDAVSSQDVTIEFAGKVGADDFVCGDTYENLGATNDPLKLTDFRFYVQDVAVQNTDGTWVPVELTQNQFQLDDVASTLA
jgi:hypothetical protein